MTQLQQYNQQGIELKKETVEIEGLTPQQQQVFELSRASGDNQKVIDLDEDQMRLLLKTLINTASIKLGSKPQDKEDILLTGRMIKADLIKKFPNLTFGEVLAANDCGLDGDFLESGNNRVFFNPSNLVQWIKMWVEKVKIPVMTKVNNFYSGLPTPTKSVSEKEMTIRSFKLFTDAVVNAKENNIIFRDYGGLIYNLLIKFEKIEPVTKEQIEAAAIHLLHEAQVNRDKSKAKSLENALETLANSEDFTGVDKPHSVACIRIVSQELQLISSWSEEGILEYLTDFRSEIQEYLNAD